MKIEIMIAVLGIICIGALAAVFVLWAKLDEQKQKIKDERECYEAMMRLHNGVAIRAQELDEKNRKLKDALKIEMERTSRLDRDCAQLEQKLRSALRCPNNDHVWKNGRVREVWEGER